MSQGEIVILSQRIEELCEKHGGLQAASEVLETDRGYLWHLRKGSKLMPGAALLRRMGLYREVIYRRRS